MNRTTSPPAAWRPALAEAADPRAALLAVAGGVAFDLGVRSGVASIGGCLAALVAAGGLHLSGRLHTAASRACLAAAGVLSVFLVVRMSPWLVPPNVVAIAGLLALAGMLARDGRLADLSLALLGSRAVLAALNAVGAAGFLVEPARRRLARADRGQRAETLSQVARGAAVAVPVVVVLAALLASGDAVFASTLHVHLPLPGDAAGHVALVVIGALGLASLLRLASAAPSGPLPPSTWRLQRTEWTIVLGGVVALFAAFATVQVVTIRGGARHVLETEGLTYAEYARSGYFQLLAVAALTGLVLGVLSVVADRATARAARAFRILAELTVALTLLVLLVALRRLGLYEDAYGWTMLRLAAKAGAIWIGLVLGLLALRLAGVGGSRAWFTPAAGGLALAVLLALDLANPEAAVARHDLARAAQGHRFDPAYVAELSDDAVPAVVAGLAGLPARHRSAVLGELCAPTPTSHGLLGWNRATSRARDARSRACSGAPAANAVTSPAHGLS